MSFWEIMGQTMELSAVEMAEFANTLAQSNQTMNEEIEKLTAENAELKVKLEVSEEGELQLGRAVSESLAENAELKRKLEICREALVSTEQTERPLTTQESERGAMGNE